jgi:hypothetical protein
MAIATLACAGQQTQPSSARPIPAPALTAPTEASAQTVMREQQGKQPSSEAASVERRKQIADESAMLLKLATDLKAEVDRTSKDTLSLSVIRKADEIEKLAHSVKEKTKPGVAGN